MSIKTILTNNGNRQPLTLRLRKLLQKLNLVEIFTGNTLKFTYTYSYVYVYIYTKYIHINEGLS